MEDREKMTKRFLWLALAMLTAGCQTPVEFGLNGLGLMTYMGTGKGLSDHVVSYVSGRDCSMRGLISDGRLCRELTPDLPQPEEKAPVFCYRTLGVAECYTQPDPFAPPSRRLN